MPTDGPDPQTPGCAAEQVDTGRPHPARMYDYYLGGTHYCAIDAETAEEVLRRAPHVLDSTRGARAWMHRAVRHLAAAYGVRQFLDLGAGLPVAPNLHQVAQEVHPACRVLYVDNDPLVGASASALLGSGPAGQVVYRHGDLRRPATVISEARAAGLFDWGRPIALVLSGVLHFVPDEDDPAGLLRAYCDALPDDSYLALSHGTGDFSPTTADGAAVYAERKVAAPMVLRSHAEVVRLFDGTALLEPGVVRLPEWHPELGSTPHPEETLGYDPDQVHSYGGVARIRPPHTTESGGS
ncbi:SAM-dependent methyltransferase [Streptomyces sp. NPDC046931]|uniref:SAM-dependent methyltransferase n=1 Tax=Streptomyces sp. NPDC046931 TaxID=3154806 RepID=UPI0033E68BF1